MRRAIVRVVSAVFVLFSARAVSADVITLNYFVHVTARTTCDATCVQVPFDATFPLTLTFDSALTSTGRTEGGGGIARLWYFGAPHFSPVPLALPPVSPQAMSQVTETRILTEPDFRAVGRAWQDNVLVIPGTSYEEWSVFLGNFERAPFTESELRTGATLGRVLNTGENPSFFFGYAQSAVSAPYSLNYTGTFAPTDATPTPEPRAFLLLASGLFGWVVRRYRVN